VRHDVLEEFISVASARDNYGVVLGDDLTLDEAATARRRDELRSRRLGNGGHP